MSLHPATADALHFIDSIGEDKINAWSLAIERNAAKGDLTALALHETLIDMFKGKEVHEVDILGLAWVLMRGELQ